MTGCLPTLMASNQPAAMAIIRRARQQPDGASRGHCVYMPRAIERSVHVEFIPQEHVV
jgi:hypothetical protein